MDSGNAAPLHLSSRGVAAAEQFEHYRAALAGVCDAHAGGCSQGFRFEATWRRVGKSLLGHSQTDAHETVSAARRDGIDHYRVLVRCAGTVSARIGAREQMIRSAHTPLVLDLSRPVRLHFSQGAGIDWIVPRDRLDEMLARPADLHGLVLCGSAASLLAEHLQRLARLGGGIDEPAGELLMAGTLGLVAACLVGPDLDPGPARDVENTLLRQMSNYVELHLHEPDLSSRQLIAFFGVSRSKLYRVFEPLGGVCLFIRERRLARAHLRLSESPQRIPLERLAEELGLRSATQLSRAFRERYGLSPRQVRLGIAPEPALHPEPAPRACGERATLAQWLRALRD